MMGKQCVNVITNIFVCKYKPITTLYKQISLLEENKTAITVVAALPIIQKSMAPSSKLLSFLLITIAILFINAEAGDVGINYGMLGNNLPTPEEVISLYKSRNVDKLRLFNPDPNALQALHGSGIEVVLGTLNQDLEVLAGDLASASNWVSTNVAPHAREVRFRYITAGNEVIPGDLAEHVLPAMQNLDAALLAANLSIPVTTVVSTEVCVHNLFKLLNFLNRNFFTIH